ncbi:hypothetical protein TPHA_0K01925 [Tetrapisispora phaffii CBS 4417]|uniref:Uncharacterized protein n=1 Tax=Tetrapisispora phaffii (strain ATCC 24235 / CBS 4417 / NBRC 1672 / NRRL Y-8282 / UCD 70-5) TaxID=1071381 RepID=G8BZJ7_TETPH|nr:hypothetical protein TPHA_0K01925 [Tetrapisispora phaffii CBS 4417]CCE65325.1 hypothetical protein TPHA_0K01925 [Tetrapisispora phaffii CBS 4417]
MTDNKICKEKIINRIETEQDAIVVQYFKEIDKVENDNLYLHTKLKEASDNLKRASICSQNSNLLAGAPLDPADMSYLSTPYIRSCVKSSQGSLFNDKLSVSSNSSAYSLYRSNSDDSPKYQRRPSVLHTNYTENEFQVSTPHKEQATVPQIQFNQDIFK